MQTAPKKRPRFAAVAAVLIVIAGGCPAGCGRNDGPPPGADQGDSRSASFQTESTEVELALNWFPEAEHGGYFAALVHGYYKEAGLMVKILPGGPNAPVIQRVAGKQVAFGVENADRVLLGRAQEADVTAVMAPLQKSPRGIMVRRGSGFRRIEDLANVTLAVNSGGAWMQYLKKRVPLRDVRFVPYSGNVSQFLVNENYAQQAYVFSEPFIARQKGIDAECLLVAETGYNPYTSVLVAHGDAVRTQPDLVRKFVAASIRGWQTYLERPEETNRHLQQINPEMGAEILAYGVASLRPLCLDGLPNADALGRMTAKRWKTLTDQLVEAEALAAGAVESDRAFTTEFLPPAALPPTSER